MDMLGFMRQVSILLLACIFLPVSIFWRYFFLLGCYQLSVSYYSFHACPCVVLGVDAVCVHELPLCIYNFLCYMLLH